MASACPPWGGRPLGADEPEKHNTDREVLSVAVQIDLLHRVTDEELLALSDRNPGYQVERTADGRLVVSPTKSDGGRRSMEVALQLGIWNRQTRPGITFDSSTGFTLPDGSCRSPDASWVRRERWYALTREQRRSFAPICPGGVSHKALPGRGIWRRGRRRARLAAEGRDVRDLTG